MIDNQRLSTTSRPAKRAVFCDFDGTIAVEETFVGMLKYLTPDLSAQLMPQMYAKQLTLREGVRQLLESIPSKRYPEIIQFSKGKLMRPGLVELLDFLEQEEVPFVVVSGGVRVMVETVMGELTNRVDAIYAVDLDASGDYLHANSSFEEGTELVSKVKVMAQYAVDEQVVIGDSLTDLNMARQAPIVFARDRLAEYLDEEQKPYIWWNDFYDVLETLSGYWCAY